MIMGVVILFTNALFSECTNALICSNLWITQSASSLIDHPKMTRFSKKQIC